MDAILRKARDLARAILGHERFARLRDVENRVLGDEAARSLSERYEQATFNMRAKEQRMEPVSPEEKRTLKELRAEVAGNALIRELAEAQQGYHELMDAVNGALHETLRAGFDDEAPEEPDEPPARPQGSRIILP